MMSQTRFHRYAARKAFSLLELTLVIAIMGILIAVTTIALGGRSDAAKIRATQATLRTISTSLKTYHLEHNAYPPDVRTLVTAKYIEDGGLSDGWNRAIVYDPRGRNAEQPFVLCSGGPDGTVGNEDDIDSWTMNKRPAN